MKLVPQAFFDNPDQFQHVYHDRANCILFKSIEIPNHRSDNFVSCNVLTIVLKGTKVITPYDGEPVTIRENQMMFIPRDLYMIQDLIPKDGAFESWLFFFSDDLIDQFLNEVKETKPNGHQMAGNDDPLVYEYTEPLRLFAEGLLSMLDTIKANTGFIRVKLLELLHLLAMGEYRESFLSTIRSLKPKKRNVKTFMESNFDKPLKVEDYAFLTGRSLTSFLRDFKTHFDTTPKQWLKAKRMEKAKSLLSDGDRNVTEIAYEIGYENISHFIKAFKDQYHISPKQFVIQHRDSGLV